MKETIKKLAFVTIMTLAGIIAMLFVSAGCIQDAITPCYINEEAANWAGEPTKMFLPYTTLWDAKRVDRAIDYKLTIEKIKAGHYKNISNISILAAEDLKSTIFSPDGALSLLLVGGPSLAAGALFIPRPKDRKTIEGLKNGNGVKV